MGSLKADVDQLNALGGTLHGLASEASALKTEVASGVGASMQSVAEAGSITESIINGALVPAVQERLSETGEIMVAVAEEYRGRDHANSQMIASAFTAATGDWKSGGGK